MKHQKLFVAVMGMRTLFACCAIVCALYVTKSSNRHAVRHMHTKKQVARKNDRKSCKAEILIALNNRKSM